jgi:integrase
LFSQAFNPIFQTAKPKPMSTITAKKELDVFNLFEKFISDSIKGKRLQPNGKRITVGTVRNYTGTLRLLRKFCEHHQCSLRMIAWNRLTTREKEREKNYWLKFYKKFSDYLYEHLGLFDNYVGMCFKNIKAFFAYLQKHLSIDTGGVQKLFYVRKEEIAIFPLLPEELNHLIYDKALENSLSKRLQQAKDFFVFGCTVALRFSDLAALQKSNLRVIGSEYYLSVQSGKTATYTLVKLPAYAIEIIRKYEKQRKKLLPSFNNVNLNLYIKQLLEKASFTQPVTLSRERRGRRVVLKNDKGKEHRFCDVASTHTMRRTAISTMLCLGMNEQMVRKISGHSPNGKEFYRYVFWAQTYQDNESEKIFSLLKEKKLLQKVNI